MIVAGVGYNDRRQQHCPLKSATAHRREAVPIEDVVVIPLIWCNEVVAVNQDLQGLKLSPWDSNLWDLAYWYRQR